MEEWQGKHTGPTVLGSWSEPREAVYAQDYCWVQQGALGGHGDQSHLRTCYKFLGLQLAVELVQAGKRGRANAYKICL